MAEPLARPADSFDEGIILNFTVAGESDSAYARWVVDGLRRKLEERGHRDARQREDAGFVVNMFDASKPRSFRRRNRAIFVLGVTEVKDAPDDVLAAGYPLLIRSLSNLLLYIVNDDIRPQIHFITLEQGAYTIPPVTSEQQLFSTLYERVAPLASSRLVIDNVFEPTLPARLWEGDELTRQLAWAGEQLDRLDLLPAPFPIQDMLSEAEWRHVRRLYSLGGLSYGNLSVRKDADTFWMSGSGVDKSSLQTIGRDMLLVTGYDEEQYAMVLSVPPEVEPNRVSVDAIEHWMIYKEHASVGAIVHVHAWMDDIPSTDINYPCGTYELAKAVAEKVREAPDPSRAIVGLRNHGLTITGRSLEDIFERIEGRIIPQVPMT